MKSIIVSFATVASIVSLAFITVFPIWIRIIIAVIGVISFLVLLEDDRRSKMTNERVCHSHAEIKKAMTDLIRVQGKIYIMSRDLTWVDSEVEKCITAKKNSVYIFVESSNELTKRLRNKGVNVLYYGHLGFEPKTRFTIIKYPRDPQVAIANTNHSIRKNHKFQHIIYETGGNNCRQDKWINSLAVDMIELCRKVCKEEIDD